MAHDCTWTAFIRLPSYQDAMYATNRVSLPFPLDDLIYRLLQQKYISSVRYAIHVFEQTLRTDGSDRDVRQRNEPRAERSPPEGWRAARVKGAS